MRRHSANKLNGGHALTRRFWSRFQRWFITGILTLIPLWITWVIFTLILAQLSDIGKPAARQIVQWIGPNTVLTSDAVETTLAVVVTLLFILLIGWAASQLLGRRLINLFDSIVQSIPLVEKIYGATKQLLSVMQQKPDEVQRVVLINFPNDSMKAVGFVTRTLTDEDTGEKIAAVYVPTTPNPTSGYLELVPIHNVISTDWTVDQAMSFIISGGAVSQETINFRRSHGAPIALGDVIGDTDAPAEDEPEPK